MDIVRQVVFPAPCNCCCQPVTACTVETEPTGGNTTMSFDVYLVRNSSEILLLNVINAVTLGVYDIYAAAISAGYTLGAGDIIRYKNPSSCGALDALTHTVVFSSIITDQTGFNGDDIPIDFTIECVPW